MSVKAKLTPDPAPKGEVGAGQRKRESAEVASAVRRMVRALGTRGAEGDLDALTCLSGLEQDLAQAMTAAVHGLRAEPNNYSWAQVGEAIGISRQAAEQRWPGTPGRKPGGQPGHLR